jgi:Spy/CpxP family protein refolding chaperone
MSVGFRTGLVALTLLAVPATVTAQVADRGGSRAEASAQRGAAGPWLGAILRNAPELNLSAEQVSRLEGIERGLRERNEPLLAQLREARVRQDGRGGARAMTPEQRAEMRERARSMTPEERERLRRGMRDRAAAATPEQRQRMRGALAPEMQPVMRQLRENTAEATREARAVLTPEQLARAQDLVRSRLAERGDRPGFQRRGDRPGPRRAR